MPRLPRTIRDRDLSDILKRLGPLTNKDLAKEASQYPHFKGMSEYAIDKTVDRFVKDFEDLDIVKRDRGRIEWLPQTTRAQGQSAKERSVELPNPVRPETQHESVQRLLRGLADGSITLKPKSPHKELNRIKGEIYDKFMADIDNYNTFKNTPLISDTLEKRIFDTALKLRAYGFIEQKEERPQEERSDKNLTAADR
jgi:hypothetical protein